MTITTDTSNALIRTGECPSWCATRTGNCDGTHASRYLPVRLSLAPVLGPPDWAVTSSDEIDVTVWREDGKPATVGIHHVAAEADLPDLTPGEADLLAVNLMRAARLARQANSPAPAAGCPSWCTFGHEGDNDPDPQHLSEMAEVPCLVTSHDQGHICGATHSSLYPEYSEPECDRPNFAQLVAAGDTGVTVEVGHGDDLLPAMTPDAALALAAGIAELATLVGAR